VKDQLIEKIEGLRQEAQGAFLQGKTEPELYEIKVRFLGKKGLLTDILKDIGQLSPEDRPVIGSLANQFKQELDLKYQARLHTLKSEALESLLGAQKQDITLPAFEFPIGQAHPISKVLREMKAIFMGMGFDVCEGPEIETDYYNFEALGIPKDHPARDMQDTFYLEDALQLLRTHTSPVQIHVMEKRKPPIQIIAPGVVYRRDSDVTHTPMFHQIEGLMVGERINLTHLKGVLQVFISEFFKKDIKVKLRPSFFPFTEPSAEVDIACVMCGGKGCRVCKNTGWL
jgi:phenylalanyl-tRNA synthetase alpha chain